MKNKIAIKLFALFAVVLVVFAIVVGSTFAHLYGKNIFETKQKDLEDRAVRIAQALSDSREQMLSWQKRRAEIIAKIPEGEKTKDEKRRRHMPLGPMGLDYGSVLRFLGSTAAEDVWIVDDNQNLEMPTRANGQKPQFMYKDLPSEAEDIVKKVLEGKITSDTGFSELLKVPTLTVGAPIKDKEGKVLGAVLIHTPLNGMDSAYEHSLRTLGIAGAAALILAFLLAIWFVYFFTKPLKQMQLTAEKMQEGDYAARCKVEQNDEVGELGTALDELGERLEEASKESAQLDQLRKDFIANISHELRTPVTVIRGSLEALNDKMITDQEKVEEYYRQMLSESIFLQRLINDLLDLSRLQNTNFKIEKADLNLCDVLQDALRSSQRLAKEKELTISLEMDTNNYPLEGDYGRLRQMLMIFLDNAIKFSFPKGAIALTLQGKRIEIIDHGEGVAKEHLPYLFDRFYKTPNETNKSGTGLGLSIAREIAERHGMKVHMESIPGEETKIVVEMV